MYFKNLIKTDFNGSTYENNDYKELANKLNTFFSSELYNNVLAEERIKNYAVENFSWDTIGGLTFNIYKKYYE